MLLVSRLTAAVAGRHFEPVRLRSTRVRLPPQHLRMAIKAWHSRCGERNLVRGADNGRQGDVCGQGTAQGTGTDATPW